MKIRLVALAFGFFLAAGTAYAGPAPGGPDSDGDTVEDAFDNCTAVANPSQADMKHNGCGDACSQSCDFDENNLVGGSDYAQIGMNWNMFVAPFTAGDCNGDGFVGGPDLGPMGMQWNMSNGPSGVSTAQCNPGACTCPGP